MRKKKLLYNTTSALLNESILLICDFILPRQILLSYGSDVNGLITSITQFLGFIALTEMGVGAVVKSALYKPLAMNDEVEISRILKSAKNFFNKIGRILLIYIAFLCVVYPPITRSEFDYAYIVPLILAISISNIALYYFGIVNQLLLTADQRSYVFLLLNATSMIINTTASILLMRAGMGIQVVKFVAAIAILIKPIGMALYVKYHYKIDRNIDLPYEPIKQKWNGIAQHLAAFVLSHTDVIVLTTFSTLKNVSIYNIYYMVVAGIRRMLTTATTGVEALYGNLYAKKDPSLMRYFSMYEWIMHTGVTLLFSVTAMLICPFISVYTQGVHDTNYIYPIFGALLVAAYGVYCIRLPYNIMVLAAGHYKETQASAILEAGINVVVSVVLVSWYGLYGVAVGTLAAMLYRSCYLAYYLSKAIIMRPFVNYLKHLAIDLATVVLIFFSTKWLLTDVSGYIQWVILAVKVFGIALVEVVLINSMIYKTEFSDSVSLVMKRSMKKKKGAD